MKIYEKLWQDIPRVNWPHQGEIFICLDPQERLGPETWSVSQFWEQDGTKDIEHCDIIGRGLFWTKSDAILFAGILERVKTKEVKIGQDLITSKIRDHSKMDLVFSETSDLNVRDS